MTVLNRFIPLLVGLLLILPRPLDSIQVDQLAPTAHATLAGSIEDMWFVPTDAERKARRSAANQSLADGVEAFGAGDYARALTFVGTPALAKAELKDWASLLSGPLGVEALEGCRRSRDLLAESARERCAATCRSPPRSARQKRRRRWATPPRRSSSMNSSQRRNRRRPTKCC